MTRLTMVAVPALFFASASCNSSSLSIDTQPADQMVAVGQTATFSVVASGTAPITYQWQLNDASIAGATQASTTTAPATIANSGSRYRVVVTDSTGSVTSNEAKLTVTGSTGPQTLTVHTNNASASGDPPVIAFQDGDGPWQSPTHSATGDYTFTVSADRYGIAVGDATGAGYEALYIVQATVSEQPSLSLPMAFAPAPEAPAQALVVDTASGNVASIVGCGVSDSAGKVSCARLPVGTYDALGAAAGKNYIFKPDQSILATPAGANNDLGLFDFDHAAFQTTTHMVTVHGLPPKQGIRTVGGFRQRYGLSGEDLTFFDPATGVPTYTADANGDVTYPITLLPYFVLSSSTLELFTISTMVPTKGSEHSSLFFVAQYFNSASDQTYAFPGVFSSTDATLATTSPYPRVQANWTPAGFLQVYGVALLDAGKRKWTAYVTSAWLAGASTAQYTFPDLSAVTGWTSALQYSSGSLQVIVTGYSCADLNTTIAVAHSPPRIQPKIDDHLLMIAKGPTNLLVP